jgi:hypothetical protein
MYTALSARKLQEIRSSSQKPEAHSNLSLPLDKIEPRVFEVMLYDIFKKRIEKSDISINNEFDNVSLMQGVGEQGRDCVLTLDGKNVGAIQCKRYKSNLTVTDFVKELIKFSLYSIKDKDIISDINNFTYYIATTTGFAGTAINYTNNFKQKISTEKEIEKWTTEIIEKYKSFENIKYIEIKDELLNILTTIKIKRIAPEDIATYLNEYKELNSVFFKVLTVTDNTLLDRIIREYLEPILKKINKKGNENDHKDFAFRFRGYLEEAFKLYSSSQTLVFGNTQKKLEDFYYPLTLTCKKDDQDYDKNICICTDNFKDDFLPNFKHVLIEDNGGMGKSTIMKWLFLSVIKQGKGIPVFIELRKLNSKNGILEELVKQLKPINKTLERQIVLELIAQGNFIFFLDGYDEIKNENREYVTTNIQDFIFKAHSNLFILTSRPEDALVAFGSFQKFTIKKLEQRESFELIRKLGNNNDKSKRLIEQIKDKNNSNIREFLQSPLLVSLLYKKFEFRESIPLRKQEFYHEVFEALFQAHDLTKGDSYIRDKKSKLSLSDFEKVLRALGYFSVIKGELEFSEGQLEKYIQEIKTNYCRELIFTNKDFIEDLVKAVPIFHKEGLKYKWSHKSFQEYFAAEFICRDTKEKQREILVHLIEKNDAEKYKLIFDLCYDIDYKTFCRAIIYPFCKKYVDFCKESYCEILKNNTIDMNLIRERQSYCFENQILFMNSKSSEFLNVFLKELMLENSPNRGFKNLKNTILIEELEDNIEKNLEVNSFNFQVTGKGITILSCKLSIKQHTIIFDLLRNKHSILLKNKEIKNNIEELSFFNNIFEEKNRYHKIDDKLNSIWNLKENFSIVNSILNNTMFNRNSNLEILNLHECEKLIMCVNDDIEKEKSDDFLLKGFF